jgi:RNA-directed DNA polymerase
MRRRRPCRPSRDQVRNRDDAERFRLEMEERLAAFGLRVAPEKTAVRHFDGRLLQGGSGSMAEKPATFIFLGFVHFQTKTLRGGVSIQRKPSGKSRERFVRKVRLWLKANLHQPALKQQAHLRSMLLGFYQYFGLYYCTRALRGVLDRVQKCWWWALRRRSQKASRRCDWPTLNRRPWFKLPSPRLAAKWV